MSTFCSFGGRTVIFRTDASLEIGTGHVMRCLTLAGALAARGARCHFICREFPGHLIGRIEATGFPVHALPAPAEMEKGVPGEELPAHAGWLGVSWQTDVCQCNPLLETLGVFWLVADHYGLDERWEQAVLPEGARLLVIDDLADRKHIADVLLDQNLGRLSADYQHLVPDHCHLMIGPDYALLRPEFAQWRQYSLERRVYGQKCLELLISLGGVDRDNITGLVLAALKECELSAACRITVVMGAKAPWLDTVRMEAASLSWHTEVVVNVDDMARRMANADLAVGAAGSTSWERCCLGLPTILLVLASNQESIAASLEREGAAVVVPVGQISSAFPRAISTLVPPEALDRASRNAARLLDGQGAPRAVQAVLSSKELSKNAQ